MKIKLYGHGPASTEIETEHEVEIYEAFVGPMLWTDDGEGLGICMRDSGFHLQYTVGGVVTDIILNDGNVSVH